MIQRDITLMIERRLLMLRWRWLLLLARWLGRLRLKVMMLIKVQLRLLVFLKKLACRMQRIGLVLVLLGLKLLLVGCRLVLLVVVGLELLLDLRLLVHVDGIEHLMVCVEALRQGVNRWLLEVVIICKVLLLHLGGHSVGEEYCGLITHKRRT